jgi:hypothetical protein
VILRIAATVLLGGVMLAQAPAPPAVGKPGKDEALLYAAEWRLMRAGHARIAWTGAGPARSASLKLETTGLVGKLYKVNDDYSVAYNDRYCVSSSLMKAQEGKKQREITVTFHRKPGKAEFVERDLLKDNAVISEKEIDVPVCVHDTIAALARFRTMKTGPGQSVELPISDGKKSAMVRIEALKRERVRTPAGEFETTRFEAHLFNNVIYRRKARLFFWLTEDERRLPVRIQVDMPFYIGNVTLVLEKEDRPPEARGQVAVR